MSQQTPSRRELVRWVSLSSGLLDGTLTTHDMLTKHLEAAGVVKKPLHQGSYAGRCGCAK